jgi:hypothetical protein
MPARLPDASIAGCAWRSTSVTCQPRAHRRSQAAAPAIPAPSTIARRSGAEGSGGRGLRLAKRAQRTPGPAVASPACLASSNTKPCFSSAPICAAVSPCPTRQALAPARRATGRAKPSPASSRPRRRNRSTRAASWVSALSIGALIRSTVRPGSACGMRCMPGIRWSHSAITCRCGERFGSVRHTSISTLRRCSSWAASRMVQRSRPRHTSR